MEEHDYMKTVNACGLSCPEPVILTSQAMKSSDSEYTVIVDNRVSKENVTRYAEHQGYHVSVTESDGEYTLMIRK